MGYSYVFVLSEHVKNTVVTLPVSIEYNVSSLKWSLLPGVVVTVLGNTVVNLKLQAEMNHNNPSPVEPNYIKYPKMTPVDVTSAGSDIHAAPSFDCIGVGQIKSLPFINDCITAAIVREFDTTPGYVTLYDDPQFGGNRTCLFLSHYKRDEIHSITKWRQNDKISSIDWSNLGELFHVQFFENPNGTGACFSDSFGWTTGAKFNKSLNDIQLQDRISSFKWSCRQPIREYVEDIPIDVSAVNMATVRVHQPKTYTGESDTNEVTIKVAFEQEIDTSTTVTVNNTNTYGWSLSSTISYTPPAVINGLGVSVTLGFTGSVTASNERSTTTSTKLIVKYSANIKIPPDRTKKPYKYVAEFTEGIVTEKKFETSATRWYNFPVQGGVKDASFDNNYKRIEKVTGTFQGGLASETRLRNLLA